jgi:hypothetical protein
MTSCTTLAVRSGPGLARSRALPPQVRLIDRHKGGRFQSTSRTRNSTAHELCARTQKRPRRTCDAKEGPERRSGLVGRRFFLSIVAVSVLSLAWRCLTSSLNLTSLPSDAAHFASDFSSSHTTQSQQPYIWRKTWARCSTCRQLRPARWSISSAASSSRRSAGILAWSRRGTRGGPSTGAARLTHQVSACV